MNCLLRNEYETDLHNNEQYLSSSNNNAWKKIQVRADRCSALPNELTSQLRASHYFGS